MLTDPFCKLSHRQNTNPASSHHIAPLDAARVCPEETRNLRCLFRHFTEQHGSSCISQATQCTKMFHHGFANMHQKCLDFQQHKISTFIIRSMNVMSLILFFPPFKPQTTSLLRHQSDICAAQQRFLPVRFFLLPLLTHDGEFVFLHTRTIHPSYGIS